MLTYGKENGAIGSMLRDKKLYIFDMDGTIYLGARVFPYAVSFINRLRASGRRVLFFTNNASHDPIFYYEKLAKMGFDPRPGEVMTAGDVTIEFLLRHRPGKSVYLVGTEQLHRSFCARGIQPLPMGAKEADIVVSSFDTSLTYEKLNDACRLIRNGAEYLCTHPDFNCPTEDGFIPDSGAIAALITASTGKEPRYFGKPHRFTVEMIAEATGMSFDDMCIFGDRLYTDIAVGRRHGISAILVLSGETDEAALAACAEADRPDAVLPSLAEADELLFDVK
ncbi:MAG: HAD-IIA family hydrolase [Clostridia bacterium]|nr:HAD-IIA family hydrolase [Clostridia bacterium]